MLKRQMNLKHTKTQCTSKLMSLTTPTRSFQCSSRNLSSLIKPGTSGAIIARHVCRASTNGPDATKPASTEPPRHKSIRVHYLRRAKDYQGWGLHTWGDVTHPTDWQQPLEPSGLSEKGSAYWDVPLKPGSRFAGFLVHAGETKSARAEIQVDQIIGDEVWLVGDEQRAFKHTSLPDMRSLPVGSINKQAAIWASRDTILWRVPPGGADGTNTFVLHHCPHAHMHITGEGVRGARESFELQVVEGGMPQELVSRWPHLEGCTALKVPERALEKVEELVCGQLLMGCFDPTGLPLDATGVQLQGVLDDHFHYDGPLGCWQEPQTGRWKVAVWAPTADSVSVLHYGKHPRGGPPPTAVAMQRGELGRGVWSATLPPGTEMYTYYKYRVTVYSAHMVRTETVEATDPYARALAADGERVCLVPPDLMHADMVPPGWSEHRAPPLAQWTDISLYELHVRDFSIQDSSVPKHLRGKFGAFVPELVAAGGGGGHGADGKLSAGLAHLAGLREAGMNHVHLLPCYDFGSVPEREEEQAVVLDDLTAYPPDSEMQQAAVLAVADRDGYNWGYDPVHYGVPEGSYAQTPDGAPRVREFREMVGGLHAQGWRVVLDVVYNHVYAAAPFNKYTVLDKIVPGYYLRRFENGEVCHSTCCNNTATEHYMCERLVVDDIVHWAKQYKVDGFRFDIMGHLMVSTLGKMREGLDALTLEQDGVDGRSIYIYGEAWDFGEMLNNARGRNCGQMNLSGTGLGAFNDRLRDGALGGGPFAPHDFQGLVTGLSLAPNGSQGQGTPSQQLAELGVLTDWVRYSMAGNLRSFPLLTASGSEATGEQALAHGQPLSYGGLPHEHIAFIGCHDNLTLFDYITEKAPTTVLAEERARMQLLCLALIAFSQGVPFFHAGDDLLRSKSLDRDSYNSGDWFNGVDWTGSTHKLGVGLPVHTKNGGGWAYKRKLLSNPLIRPTPAHLASTSAIFRSFLRMRYSSPLFRLPTTPAILAQVKHHNTGPSQVPGVVMMEVESAAREEGGSGAVYDPTFERVVVVVNCSPLAQVLPYPASASTLHLHPEQARQDPCDTRILDARADDTARTVAVPARTAAVFVTHRV